MVVSLTRCEKFVQNPIKRYGYVGEGRRAMRALRDKVLKTIVLRRTKEERQADMLLPARFITVKKTGLSEAEQVEFFLPLCPHISAKRARSAHIRTRLAAGLSATICHPSISARSFLRMLSSSRATTPQKQYVHISAPSCEAERSVHTLASLSVTPKPVSHANDIRTV